MEQQLDRDRPIDGTYVFDWRLSRRGYRLNKLRYSLSRAENRAAFTAGEEAYYDRYGLAEAEKGLIRKRDFLGLIKAGTNIYMMLKLGAATMRGALAPKVSRIERGYYNPMTTGIAVLALEDAA